MKKILIFALIIIMMGSCSSYYSNYNYHQYFQKNEPLITVYSEDAATLHISNKVSHILKHNAQETIGVLSFTDENGGRIDHVNTLPQKIVSLLDSQHNPKLFDHAPYYKFLEENQLAGMAENTDPDLAGIFKMDYILHGRILKEEFQDRISIRCFNMKSGEVIYAGTICINYAPDEVFEQPQEISGNPNPHKTKNVRLTPWMPGDDPY
ncbi:MAG: hypothetical protein KAU44_01615 [Candidatus Marinimicrobia bacterium]|nr:hypothetical protein [Candidatus Neomarinimicrobiota bacterium]